MRKNILFFCPSQEALAEEIVVLRPEIILGKIEWQQFSDGFPNLRILNAAQLADIDVIFLADFNNATEIFRQLAVIYALPAQGINSLKVFLPFFSTGTMDRIMTDGQIVTAKTLARMLSVIPMAACPAQIIIFDIHALQEQFYFSDQVRVRCVTGINLFLEQLQREAKDPTNCAIAFPDEGAYKRYGRYFDGYDCIVCEKRRQADDTRFITIKEGDPQNKEVIMVDDLILSGQTLLECAAVLTKAGAIKVSAYATHGVFPNESWKKFFAAGVGLYLTNSCPKTVGQIINNYPQTNDLKVISLAPAIIKEITSNSL